MNMEINNGILELCCINLCAFSIPKYNPIINDSVHVYFNNLSNIMILLIIMKNSNKIK